MQKPKGPQAVAVHALLLVAITLLLGSRLSAVVSDSRRQASGNTGLRFSVHVGGVVSARMLLNLHTTMCRAQGHSRDEDVLLKFSSAAAAPLCTTTPPTHPGLLIPSMAAVWLLQAGDLDVDAQVQREEQQQVAERGEQPAALAVAASAHEGQQEGETAEAHQPQQTLLPKLACAIYNNVSNHLDVAAGMAWALQVRGSWRAAVAAVGG